ncbi:MAG: tetratricopeptide repeat protein [Pyrinomonadaceae bacterium]
MKAFGSLLFIVICVLAAQPVRTVTAKDTWTSIRSRNYLLIGNASEEDIRTMAVQLERFRDVFTKQFKGAALNSPVPTTVIVFKSDGSFGPYKPLVRGKRADVAGYFQSGFDMNYITLSAEPRRQYNPYEMIFHESVHLLVDNKVRTSPAWFNEGLAEYFSALDFPPDKTGGGKLVVFGKPILRHILMLRQKQLLPLATLFGVDRASPYYNEREKSGMFYAQSWALIHYLTHGQARHRQPQLARFLELLASGTPLEQGFQQAFESDYATLEKELKEYVRQDKYRGTFVPYVEPADSDRELKSVPLTEAQALAYLGDLLLHYDHGKEAEKHLMQALALTPELSAANASLGMLRVHQRDFAAAKEHLQRAMKSDPQNYLAHYYYAYALSSEPMDQQQIVTGYEPETAAQMRATLKRAMEIAPGFPEPYRLLAFVNLITNTRLDEAVTLLEHALTLSPGRHEFSYVLAQVHLRRKNYKAARVILEQVIAGNPNPQMRALSQEMLETVRLSEKYQMK